MSNESVECPISDCGYNANMQAFDAALAGPLNLQSTRSNANPDAHRDMDGFDEDVELARLRKAVAETERVSPTENPALYSFIAKAFANIDEQLQRLGPLPHAWKGSAQTWVGTEKPSRELRSELAEEDEADETMGEKAP